MVDLINAENGRILVSAKSGYGKTYLVTTLLKEALKSGWRVYILSYTEKKEAELYWNELIELGAKITYTKMTTEKVLLDFLADIEGNAVIYVDDLDLYIKRDAQRAIATLRDYFSASRKANIIVIFSIKVPKKELVDLLQLTEIVFLGKFTAYSPSLNALGIEDLKDKMRMLDAERHQFLYINGDEVRIVRATEDGIVFDDV